jgi:2-keto-4-pentenoate hydratase/2-oxohepta-3-ene-1,7-dioic acid hydratase in catechol pathway
MKIVSFVRPVAAGQTARIESGVVCPNGAEFVSLDKIAELSRVAESERFNALLAMPAAERAALALRLPTKGEPLSQVRLLPASPRCPLFLVLHGNSPMIFKRQNKRGRWTIPRVPFPRCRPWSALSGSGDIIDVPLGARFSHGAEFGLVIGEPAWRVSEEQALDHIPACYGFCGAGHLEAVCFLDLR